MRKFSKKTLALVVSLVLVLTVGVGGTLAYLLAATNPLVNTFTPSKVTTFVEEDISTGVKKDVKIQNTGNTDAYIRAAVLVTWQDTYGNVYGQEPVAGTDYEITLKTGSVGTANNWFLGKDGFYYYSSPVAPDGYTGILIDTCSYVKNAPVGYSLCVEIIGSGVQAVPAKAVLDWSDNNYTIGTNDVLVAK